MLYRDQLVYVGAVVQRFVESYVVDIKFDLDAVIDGNVHHFDHLLDVIVKNTKIFGGEWIFDPQAESDDGRFELVPITGRRDFDHEAARSPRAAARSASTISRSSASSSRRRSPARRSS